MGVCWPLNNKWERKEGSKWRTEMHVGCERPTCTRAFIMRKDIEDRTMDTRAQKEAVGPITLYQLYYFSLFLSHAMLIYWGMEIMYFLSLIHYEIMIDGKNVSSEWVWREQRGYEAFFSVSSKLYGVSISCGGLILKRRM